MDIKSTFKAIYNPYTRNLLVRYGDALIEHYFEHEEEWICINYNDDELQPYYLHVQLDYDETFQLLFYPRKEEDQYLNEEYGSYYNSGLKNNSRNIKIVHTDIQWDKFLVNFLKASESEVKNYKKINR